MNVASVFEGRFSKIDTVLPFNPNWSNGTGYYSNATQGPNCVQLPPGVCVKCTDLSGRKMIFVGTRFGTIVVFQRYSNRDNVVVHNAPHELKRLALWDSSGNMAVETLIVLVGDPDNRLSNNIGSMLEALFALDEKRKLGKISTALEFDDE